jgi:hypothetical protein
VRCARCRPRCTSCAIRSAHNTSWHVRCMRSLTSLRPSAIAAPIIETHHNRRATELPYRARDDAFSEACARRRPCDAFQKVGIATYRKSIIRQRSVTHFLPIIQHSDRVFRCFDSKDVLARVPSVLALLTTDSLNLQYGGFRQPYRACGGKTYLMHAPQLRSLSSQAPQRQLSRPHHRPIAATQLSVLEAPAPARRESSDAV